MQSAESTRDRLRNALPRLQARYQEAAAAEYLTRWRSQCQVVEAERDGLAAELRELYPDFVTKIAGLFTRIAANDAEITRLHQERPAGVSLRLLGAELVARGLEDFTRDTPSIGKELKLPDFKHGDRMAWPPPRTPLAVLVAMSMTPAHDPRLFSGDWAQAQKDDNSRRAANEARWAKEEEKRQVKSRRAHTRRACGDK